MGALVKSRNPRFELLPAIDPRPRRRDLAVREIHVREPRAFPEASTPPALPSTIPDEMLELYAFIFCQSGFRQLGMTFEQFLLVAATLKPGDLPATREEALAF